MSWFSWRRRKDRKHSSVSLKHLDVNCSDMSGLSIKFSKKKPNIHDGSKLLHLRYLWTYLWLCLPNETFIIITFLTLLCWVEFC